MMFQNTSRNSAIFRHAFNTDRIIHTLVPQDHLIPSTPCPWVYDVHVARPQELEQEYSYSTAKRLGNTQLLVVTCSMNIRR